MEMQTSEDVKYRFFCVATAGTAGQLLSRFDAMPLDHTLFVSCLPYCDERGNSTVATGGCLEIAFTAEGAKNHASAIREWLVEFIRAHAGSKELECVLFSMETEDRDNRLFGVPTWSKCFANDEALTRSIALAAAVPKGLSVLEQLKWRSAREKEAMHGTSSSQ